jgi:hypothetical protein
MRSMRVLALLVNLLVLVCIEPELATAATAERGTKESRAGKASRDIDAEIVSEIEKKGGNNDFVGLDSNQIIEMLENPEYATEITGTEAVAYTKKGITVIVGLEGKPKGHVAEVAPAEMVDSKTKWGMVPKIFALGGKDGMLPLSEIFSPSGPMPRFFIRNVDMQAAAGK